MINLFIFDDAAEPLDEDVFYLLTASIQADGDFMLFENSGKRIACELRALARVESLRLRRSQRSSQRALTKLIPHHRREFPTDKSPLESSESPQFHECRS